MGPWAGGQAELLRVPWGDFNCLRLGEDAVDRQTDYVMLADIFDPDPARDPLIRAADERGGAASIMVGIAADHCFETGQPVRIADLVTGLERPDYPRMPGHSDPVPMPMRTSQV